MKELIGKLPKNIIKLQTKAALLHSGVDKAIEMWLKEEIPYRQLERARMKYYKAHEKTWDTVKERFKLDDISDEGVKYQMKHIAGVGWQLYRETEDE